MTSLVASPLLAAGLGDPNGPNPYRSIPLVVPSAVTPTEPAQPYQPVQPSQPVQPVGPEQVLEPQPGAATAEQDQFTAAQLQEMVAAIALYPDPLLAQILAGATYPLDIVQASRFIKANANDPALADRISAEPWDPSVQALARYPSVLAMMDENLQWTQALGAAFIHQQEDVMNAIQVLRAQAQTAGNLATTQEQRVIVEERIIYIEPADPQVIYVPVYEPEIVYVPRPTYYVGHTISFGIGFAVGSWLDLDCDWRHRNVYRGGWYHRHHSNHHKPTVNVHVHKDVNIHRDRDDHRDHRDDARHDRYDSRDNRRDVERRDDDRQRQASVWRRDVSKPAPQVRATSQDRRIITPIRRPVSNIKTDSPTVRDDARSERDADARTSDARDGDRSRNGFVRPTPGFVRPVTPPVTATRPTPDPRPSNTPTDRNIFNRSVFDRNTAARSNDRIITGRSERSDRDDPSAEDRTAARTDRRDETRIEPRVGPPVQDQRETRPTFNGSGDRGR